MHEMSLMEGILNRAADALSEYKVAKVNSLTVRVGVLANVMPAAFEFAFEALTDDTICLLYTSYGSIASAIRLV